MQTPTHIFNMDLASSERQRLVVVRMREKYFYSYAGRYLNADLVRVIAQAAERTAEDDSSYRALLDSWERIGRLYGHGSGLRWQHTVFLDPVVSPIETQQVIFVDLHEQTFQVFESRLSLGGEAGYFIAVTREVTLANAVLAVDLLQAAQAKRTVRPFRAPFQGLGGPSEGSWEPSEGRTEGEVLAVVSQ